MKNLSIILPVLFSFMSFNQHNKKVKTILNDFNNFCEVTKADSISANDIIDGIAMSNGFGGTIFQFDLNFTYKKISYDCVSRLIIDSGKWSIKNNKILVLNSNDQTLSFNILKFDKFYFFILPSQFPKLIEDLKNIKGEI